MYGNFDAIKRRKQLRKETTDARQKRVDDLKGRTFRDDKHNVFPEVAQDTVTAVTNRIRLQQKKTQRKERLVYGFLFVIAAAVIAFLCYRYIYPSLF